MSGSDSSSSRSRAGQAGLQPALDAVLREPAGDVLRRALWLEAVDRQLRPKLPVALAPHVRLANVTQGRLSLHADAAIWAHRSRWQVDDIVQAARSIGLQVDRVVVKVAPPAPLPSPTPEKQASSASRGAIEDALRLLGDPD